MKRAAALVLLIVLVFSMPAGALAQTPSPAGAVEQSPAPVDATEPTERFVYVAVGLLFVLIFFLGVAYMKNVMKSAESR